MERDSKDKERNGDIRNFQKSKKIVKENASEIDHASTIIGD